jgi:hypothetical protein
MKTEKIRLLMPLAPTAAVLVWSVVRFYRFIEERAVNLLYWDQWDYYTPLFEHKSGWELFIWQHGFHRQGLGNLLIKFLAERTGWNTRADAFAIFGILCLATIVAILMKVRLSGQLTVTDAVIPATVLSFTQYETIIGTPNESASALPLLLLLLYGITWLIPHQILRYLAISMVNFFLIFTGYSVLVAPLTMLLLLIQAYFYWRKQSKAGLRLALLALLSVITSLALFLVDYHFLTGVTCFRITRGYVVDYPQFAGLILARFIGVSYRKVTLVDDITGIVILSIFCVVGLFHLIRLFRREGEERQISLVITTLIGFSLIFCLATAAGRICLGMNYAQSSRYMTLIAPAYLGLYFHLFSLKRPKLRWMLVLILAASVFYGSLNLTSKDQRSIETFSTQKESWKACYLEIQDVARCNDLTDFKIYPEEDGRFTQRLNFLKENGLNLYLDVGQGPRKTP